MERSRQPKNAMLRCFEPISLGPAIIVIKIPPFNNLILIKQNFDAFHMTKGLIMMDLSSYCQGEGNLGVQDPFHKFQFYHSDLIPFELAPVNR